VNSHEFQFVAKDGKNPFEAGNRHAAKAFFETMDLFRGNIGGMRKLPDGKSSLISQVPEFIPPELVIV
jgi:hypothetical protein